jgi:hypothetical protein
MLKMVHGESKGAEDSFWQMVSVMLAHLMQRFASKDLDETQPRYIAFAN